MQTAPHYPPVSINQKPEGEIEITFSNNGYQAFSYDLNPEQIRLLKKELKAFLKAQKNGVPKMENPPKPPKTRKNKKHKKGKRVKQLRIQIIKTTRSDIPHSTHTDKVNQAMEEITKLDNGKILYIDNQALQRGNNESTLITYIHYHTY